MVNKMKQITCFGEVLIDFVNTSSKTDGLLNLKSYTQFPSGAPASASVCISKLGGNAYMAGQVGDDMFGDFIIDSLKKYNVHTDFLLKHKSAKTTLVFVALDEDGERSFSFHRDNTADVLFPESEVCDGWFKDEAIIHFGSLTLTDDVITNVTKTMIKKAKKANSLLSFDVNLRHNLWDGGNADINLINEIAFKVDLIKFAREEFDYLCEGRDEEYIKKCFDSGVSLILITDGGNDIEYITAQKRTRIPVPKVKVIDTTGGGDAFIGSFLFCISQFEDPKSVLTSTDKIEKIVKFASNCGAKVVAAHGIFTSLPYFEDIKEHWPTEIFK